MRRIRRGRDWQSPFDWQEWYYRHKPLVLFDYRAGMPISRLGGTHTRADASTCATYVDSAGVVQTVAANVLRDSHFVGGNRTVLLEGARTNKILRSEEFDDAAWTKSSLTVTANDTTAPDGTATADRLTQTAAGGACRSAANIGFTGNDTKAISVFMKFGAGSAASELALWDNTAGTYRHQITVTWTAGVPSLSTLSGSGTLFPVQALANGWYRIMATAASVVAANTNHLYIRANQAGVNGDYIWAWGAQAED